MVGTFSWEVLLFFLHPIIAEKEKMTRWWSDFYEFDLIEGSIKEVKVLGGYRL